MKLQKDCFRHDGFTEKQEPLKSSNVIIDNKGINDENFEEEKVV